jgi:tetratricopeptide (TPR) repeat protein
MRFKVFCDMPTLTEISRITAYLLAKLREGDIWAVTEKEADEFIELAIGASSNKISDQIVSMRLRSLVAELADRRGWWDSVGPRALRNLDSIEVVFFKTTPEIETGTEQANWVRQAAWLLLHESSQQHRNPSGHDLRSPERHEHAAIKALDLSLKIENQLRLVLPEEGNHELLYRLAFNIARHNQVLKRYSEAKGQLGTSLHHCYQHRREITADLVKLDPAKKVEREHLDLKNNFTIFNTIVVITNFGRIDVERGELLEALPQLLIARTLLLDSKEIVIKGYVDLLLGSIYRQIGAPSRQVSGVVSADPELLLESAVKYFTKANHRQLRDRAILELAHHYYGLATQAIPQTDAQHLLKKATEVLAKGSKSPDDKPAKSRGAVERWDAQSHLLLARIEHSKQALADDPVQSLEIGSSAVNRALTALKLCKQIGRGDLETIANLVLAELSIERGDYIESLAYCEAAEQLRSVDKADQAWLYVIYAKALIKMGNKVTAESYFANWKEMEKDVQNVHIQKKAKDVEQLLRQKHGFYVGPNDTNRKFYKRVEELRLFLLQSVESLSLLEQAKILGLEKQAVATLRSKMIRVSKLQPHPKSKRNRR